MSEAVEQQSERGAGSLEPGDAEACAALAHDLTHTGYSLIKAAQENAARSGARVDRAEVKAALAAFQRAADLDPTNSYALSCLGRLQGWLGDKRGAITTLKAALAAGTNDLQTHLDLCLYQSRMRQYRGMARTMKAIEALSDSPERDEHYRKVYRLGRRFQIALAAMVCLIVFLVWRRRRA